MAITLEQISTLMDQKLDTLRVQITKDIEKKLQDRIETNSRNIAGNTATLEGQTQKFEQLKIEHDKKIEELQSALNVQAAELDDLANRSMRGNIVVRGLEEVDNEGWMQPNTVCVISYQPSATNHQMSSPAKLTEPIVVAKLIVINREIYTPTFSNLLTQTIILNCLSSTM